MNKILAINSGFPNPRQQDIGKFIATVVISKLLKTDFDNIHFRKNSYGKPLISGVVDQVYFSLSHTDSWIFLAISTEADIGIDAEVVSPVDINTALEFCTEKEMEIIKSDLYQKFENYYKLWTLKESFLKNIGTGLLYPIKQIEFRFNNNIRCYRENKILDDYFFEVYKLNNMLVSLCQKNRNFPKSIEVYRSLGGFINNFNINSSLSNNYAKIQT